MIPQRIKIPLEMQVPGASVVNEIPILTVSRKYHIYFAYHRLIRSQYDLSNRLFDQDYLAAGMGHTARAARFICLMEMIERMSATSSENITRYIQMTPQSRSKMDWFLFAPYDTKTQEEIAEYKEDKRQYWLPCHGLLTKKTYAVPAECIIPYWEDYEDLGPKAPEYSGNGIAASLSRNKNFAIDHGLKEILEREAAMLSWRLPNWYCQSISCNRLPKNAIEYLKSNRLKIEFFDVGDPNLESVILAIVSRKDDSEVTIGLSCQRGIAQAALKSFYEAIMLRYTAKIEIKLRGDRSPAAPRDSFEHITYAYLNGPAILDWYRKLESSSSYLKQKKRKSTYALAKNCQKVFHHEPLFIDLTTSSPRKSGYFICRILIPNAYRQEYSHRKAYWGGQRLLSFCHNRVHLNRRPHPFG